jgi:ketosteroid isomerase-like protein
MPRSSLAAFTALWRAYGEGRIERSLDLLDAECELVLLDGESTFRGHDGIRRWLEDVRHEWKTLTVTYAEVHEADPTCIVGIGRVSGTSADGARTLDAPLACVGEFRDGRLVRAKAFADTDDAMRYVRSREQRDGTAA